MALAVLGHLLMADRVVLDHQTKVVALGTAVALVDLRAQTTLLSKAAADLTEAQAAGAQFGSYGPAEQERSRLKMLQRTIKTKLD
jgi:hypothetical protein